MTSKRLRALLLAIVTLTLIAATAADGATPGRPTIRVAGGTPPDLERLARSTWLRFTDAFPARWNCLGPATVVGAWRFPVRARYDPALRVVTVRIPGTAPNLASSLVHEFAHQLDFSCPAIRRLRGRFLATEGLPAETPWFRAAAWDRIPSERFAEATVAAVMGGSANLQLAVWPSAVAAIRAWGRGP